MHPKNHASPYPTKVLEPTHPLMAAFTVPSKPQHMHFIWCKGGTDYVADWPVVVLRQQLCDELYIYHRGSNPDHAARVLFSIDGAKLADLAAKNPEAKYTEYPDGEPEFGYALIWIKRDGKGRVYYSQIGHMTAVYTLPCISRGYLDGIQYVTGDLKCPDEPVAAEPAARSSAAGSATAQQWVPWNRVETTTRQGLLLDRKVNGR